MYEIVAWRLCEIRMERLLHRSLDIAASLLRVSFLRCWTSNYGTRRLVTVLAAVSTRNCSHLAHCAPPTLFSLISVRLCIYVCVISHVSSSFPDIFVWRSYLLCVVQYEPCALIVGIISISVFCVSPWNINVATSQYTVFVLSHVSLSVEGSTRQSVFRAWHTTFPPAFASERYRPPITFRELYVLNSVTQPQV